MCPGGDRLGVQGTSDHFRAIIQVKQKGEPRGLLNLHPVHPVLFSIGRKPGGFLNEALFAQLMNE